MIELNLLPDVKMEFIKANQTRRLVLSVCVLSILASVMLLVGLLSVDGLQKKHISDLSNDITSYTSNLQKQPNIAKILTVQNQLGSLNNLHSTKYAASRLFDYLNQVTPANVNITSLNIDFTSQTATITGTSDSLGSVNKYVDTLKFTTYTSDTNTTPTNAFSNVVLTSFGVNTASKDSSQAATYTITLNYDKNIFDITQNIKLSVPNVTTTRLQSSSPTDLFKTTSGGSK